MNFSKIFFEVNVILGCTLVSDNNTISNIILEEEYEIKEMLKEYVKSKNFLKKNAPLIIRLLESKYSYISIDEINSIVRQFNTNFKKKQINSEENLDKENCIKDFNEYICTTYDKMFKKFGKLIVKKIKNSSKVKDNPLFLLYKPKYCIDEFLVSLKENQCDIKLNNNEFLLEIFIDFLSMYNFYIDIINFYEELRFLIVLIIKVKKRMLNSHIFKNKNMFNSFKFDGIYSPEIKEALYEEVLNCILRMNIRKETNIEDNEKFKNYCKEFSRNVVDIIISIEKYNNSYNNNLTNFTIDTCIFKYLNNNNDSLKKEIQQLNIKLSNYLLKESERYNRYLFFCMNCFYSLYSNIYIPFSFYKERDTVLENYEEVENDQGIIFDYVIDISSGIVNGYCKILLILFNPSLTRYLIS
ncbi:hypothetical protein A0H76_2890 [Hepatospora eriocheir]|uniref:Uncharacterized protein n=1 Tax=Hepatospora eriocheir TaxID=1081669 RepID=A0A1X0Q5M3_9MICR|nr:hypothetical protein A0H76_2890 [Hepatospora eriocheir]